MIYSTGYYLIYLHIWWILTTCRTAFNHVVKTQLHISLWIILKYHKTRIINLYKKIICILKNRALAKFLAWASSDTVAKWALWAERLLARHRHVSARTWHTTDTVQACHHSATHMPRRATLVPPLRLWHAKLVPRPGPLCAARDAPLACPWPVTHFHSTITVCCCNASHTETHTHWSPKAESKEPQNGSL